MNCRFIRRRVPALCALGALVLTLIGCGESKQTATASAALPSPSAGQVAPASAAPKASFYAASRFAEQASFGPTPALVAELQTKGFERWIDEQFALPVATIDIAPVANRFDSQNADESAYARVQFGNLALTAPDQLRLRVVWSLSQWLVMGGKSADALGRVTWLQMLMQQAFGNYGSLLRELSIHPMMGYFLDNAQNRPKSAECPACAPNENFARELLQLFSIGVLELQTDGTPRLDRRGKVIETYTQNDVAELARALTGWGFNPDPPNRQPFDWGNWRKPMAPSTWPPERDAGRKVVLGKVLPAGQAARKDLDDVIDLLMAHPNVAPFISLRLIQHLVTSDPTPAYLGRVAAKFRDNGAGVAGDLKATVKAVLLDEEARRGDVPAQAPRGFGKYREPYLWYWAVLRNLDCKRYLKLRAAASTSGMDPSYFNPLYDLMEQESVFGFYMPTDRAPGSQLLAPEQAIVTAVHHAERFYMLRGMRWSESGRADNAVYLNAGCDLQPLVTAFSRSPAEFTAYVERRYFRSAMPPLLRQSIEHLMRTPSWDVNAPDDGALTMLGFALATPQFGVIR